MESDILVRWTKHGRRAAHNRNQATIDSLKNCDISIPSGSNTTCDSDLRKLSLSPGSSDEEMIDITAGGEALEGNFQEAHSSHSK